MFPFSTPAHAVAGYDQCDVWSGRGRYDPCDSCHAATLCRHKLKVKNYVWCPRNSPPEFAPEFRPSSEETFGHGTTGRAKFWKKELAELLQSAPRRAQ